MAVLSTRHCLSTALPKTDMVLVLMDIKVYLEVFALKKFNTILSITARQEMMI